MYVRQILGGSTRPKYLTDVCPTNICRVYTPQIFDGVDTPSLTDVRQILGGSTPRQICRGCGPPKYLTDIHPSNILDI